MQLSVKLAYFPETKYLLYPTSKFLLFDGKVELQLSIDP